MLLTLGCYGFVYTNTIARGFAPAQMLTLCGVSLLLGRRPLLAGVCLGAACCCNYLAVFVGVAVVLAGGGWLAAPAGIDQASIEYLYRCNSNSGCISAPFTLVLA